ncbi:MAG: cytochrome c oxidase subunit II [Caulobacter sp.]|nr:cytochrome c oxidase subunit II [Caulobacter sp.]
MNAKVKGMRGLFAAFAAVVMTAMAAGGVRASELIGQPSPGGMGLQPAGSPLKQQVIFFHDAILLPIITVICLFVLGLLLWILVRYNKRSNPTPAKWSHNTLIEVVWTLVPVLILMVIAIFSFRLLFDYHNMPKPYMTVKAVGYQWNWGYEYPDQKIPEYISAMLPEKEVAARGLDHSLFRLAATEPMVVPVGKVVRVQVTGADVIHNFALPAFGLKTDAIPGRLNETWFKADKIGAYYGQCSELCGVDHAFMPIEIKVVSQADFDAWVASKAPAAAPAPVAAPAADGATLAPIPTAAPAAPAAGPAPAAVN